MRNFICAFFLVCVSMQVSALVVEPEQKPVTPKSRTPKNVSVPIKAARTDAPQAVQTKAPPSEESVRFFRAAILGNFDMMRLYLARGADINCDNCGGDIKEITPLMAVSSSLEVLKFLLENGANVNQQNSYGKTALMSAASLGGTIGDSERIVILTEHGATANLADKDGHDALYYLIMSGIDYQRFVPLAKLLISKGALVNRQDSKGTTLLMHTASNCGVDATKLLLTLGANPKLETKFGETALMFAEKAAMNSLQGSACNQVYAVLSDPARYMNAVSSGDTTISNQGNSSSESRHASYAEYSAYIGSYLGNYSGDDDGSFQVDVTQDGSIKLSGKSFRTNQAFTGTGKMNKDGSLGITLGNISTGATFQGSINPKNGGLYGTWKNGEQAGNFSGSKQTTQAQVSNPIEAIGGLLNGLNKVLAK